ncbi:MAG: ABC transporter ATP-binding protein, partial [Candidatus Scatosoma sp.]
MLELISVNKKYVTKAGDTNALNNVSLRFPDKGMVFITGKSGSGKTTLLNVIGGLDGFDSGEIILDGKSFSNFSSTDFDSYRNTYVGFVFQEYNLLPEYNVIKNVALAEELQGRKCDKTLTDKLFEDIEITGLEERKVSQLSGGQKQRVAIVRALAKSSKIILADELTGALDSVTGEQVLEILKKLSAEKLVVIVSHDLDLAEKYADRMIRLVDGKVIEDVSLKDEEVNGNVYSSENQVTVKIGGKLSPAETKELVAAVEEKKNVVFTEKFSVRTKRQTVQAEIKQNNEPVKFINSKMKFSSALSLGLKSVFVKPVRLIVTILLSFIAFSCCGVFDAVASYDDAKAVTSLLRERYYQALPVYATCNGEIYDDAKIKVSQKYIEELNVKTGYS